MRHPASDLGGRRPDQLPDFARRLGTALVNTDIGQVADNLKHPLPLLLIHDPDDPDSPHETSERIAEVWPGATLITTRGLGRLAHYRILRHRPAIDAGLRFID